MKINEVVKTWIEIEKEIAEKLQHPLSKELRSKYEGCLGLIQRLEVELVEVLKTLYRQKEKNDWYNNDSL